MRDNLQKLADLHKEVRELLGITQAELAKRLGISQAQLCNIEKGRRDTKGTNVIELHDLKRKALIKLAKL